MNIEITPFHGCCLPGNKMKELVALFRQLDNEEIDDYKLLGLKMTTVDDSYFENKLESDEGFIAVCDGKIVGMLSNVEADEYENAMYLSRFVVDKDYRKRGIGRKLLDKAVKSNNSRGKKTMLNVSARNIAALLLYKSAGFVEHSHTMIST